MPFRPSPGTIVTYVDDRDDDIVDGGTVFHRAVAVGTELVDPQNRRAWLPVIRSDGVVTLVDAASVVDVLPEGDTPGPDRDPAEVIEVTYRALDVLARGLAAPSDDDVRHTEAVLDEFLDSISPVQSTVDVLTTVDPTGTLAVAVIYLIGANAYLENGDVVATRSAIDAAHMILDGLSIGDIRDCPDT